MDASSTKAAFDTASNFSEWSTIIVAIGVFVELAALFIFSAKMPPLEKKVMVFATLLIVAGCVGEFIFGSRANEAASILQSIEDSKIAALNTDAEGLKRDAAKLSAEAESARAAIAEAQEQTQSAKRDAAVAEQRANEAAAGLERAKRPRTLGTDTQQSVAAAILPFAGQKYRAAISQGADDGVVFWESLHAALEKGGWVYVPPEGPPTMGNPPAGIPIAAAPGVDIRVDPAKATELALAALALANALQSDGQVAVASKTAQSSTNEADHDTFTIVIGARVPPR